MGGTAPFVGMLSLLGLGPASLIGRLLVNRLFSRSSGHTFVWLQKYVMAVPGTTWQVSDTLCLELWTGLACSKVLFAGLASGKALHI
jgi:hypothetical protein